MEDSIALQILAELKDLREGQQKLEQNQQKLEQNQQKQADDFADLKEEQFKQGSLLTRLVDDVDRLRHIVVRMEDDHGQKLKALLDGDDSHRKRGQNHERRIVVLESDVEEHEMELQSINQVLKR